MNKDAIESLAHQHPRLAPPRRDNDDEGYNASALLHTPAAASLETSLFAAFLAMLGEQWVNCYLRDHGGSAADKSWDRQRKPDGLEEWHFHIVIKSLPVMLQFVVLLFRRALSVYLWTISHAVVGVISASRSLGPPYPSSQPALRHPTTTVPIRPRFPPSSGTSENTWRVVTPPPPTQCRLTRNLPPGPTPAPGSRSDKGFVLESKVRCRTRVAFRIHQGAWGFGYHSPLPDLAPIDFGSISVDWAACEADSRCISWTLDFTTDSDVTFYVARFAAHTTCYLEITGTFSPHVLANVGCISYEQVIPGKLEYVNGIGVALIPILGIRLCVESEREDL